MAVIHADLVGPLPEGKNSRGQRGFQYILSIVDSTTYKGRYVRRCFVRAMYLSASAVAGKPEEAL